MFDACRYSQRVQPTLVLAVIFILATALLSCSHQEVYTAYLSDDQGSISLPAGAKLELFLDANPAVKHLWVIDRLDESVLLYSKKELVTLNEESKFGGNKFRKFTFTALKPGTTTLNIDFTSLWEDDDEDEADYLDTFTLTITVTE
jgi:predicted secreted protein